MPRKKKLDLRVKYFSERLLNKLAQITEAPAICVEAPSGYGKTTAVHEFLQKNAADKAVWFTAVEGEARAAGWARLCRKLALVDKRVGNALLSLGLPDADTIGEAAELFGQFACASSAWLVVDNAQLLAHERSVFRSFKQHGCGALHVVFISQPLEGGTFLGGDVPYIGKEDFALSAAEIRAYFQKAGIAIDMPQAEAIERNTEGWMAAVYMALLRYGGEQSVDCAALDIHTLMREVAWEHLEEDAQNLLLPLAPFSCFTKQQLLFMAELGEHPACLKQALSGSGFIRCDARQGVYYPHALFSEFLRGLFAERSEAYQRSVWTRAGQWNEETGNKLAAVECYYAARDFESLFALKLRDVELQSSGNGAVAMMEDIVESCPVEIKLRHPMTLVSLAYKLFAAARHERFLRLCGEIEALIPQTAFDMTEQNRLLGELAMMRSFAAYNDIEKMSEQHALAYRLIGGRSQSVDTSAPWAMGCPSVLYMFHSGVGKLSHELGCMERCLPDYVRLAENHGKGADLVLRAETAFFKGDIAAADLFGLRGAYTASTVHQGSILLCAEFLLARVALANGDAAAFASAVAQMEHSAHGAAPSMRTALELAMGHLLLMLNREGEVAEWLIKGDFTAKGLLAPAIPYAQMLHLYACFQTGNYRSLFSLADLFLARAERQRVLIPQIYIRILLSCACHREGAGADARKHMELAVRLALPDGLIAPFAELSADALPVLNAMPREFDCCALQALAKSMEQGKERIRHEMFKSRPPHALTEREHEIALLAAQRKSNEEIAALTCLTVATVRTHLRVAYGKMGIDTNSKNKRHLLEEKL